MENDGNSRIAYLLVAYLGLAGICAVLAVIAIFPATSPKDGTLLFTVDGSLFSWLIGASSVNQGLLKLAFYSGIAGSFLHAAQSLVSYIGNGEFKPSWAAWYFLRPWIGGVLGFALYFAFRAGLVQGTEGLNPHGVVAVGMLGGWFSKTTADKLQEVFRTLFPTDEDKYRKHKLDAGKSKPALAEVTPDKVTLATGTLKITGANFTKDSMVLIGEQKVEAKFISEKELALDLSNLPEDQRKGRLEVKVLNPGEPDRFSGSVPITFSEEPL